MDFPPPPSSLPPAAFHPEPLQAVVCPACFGALAVGADLLGRPAECPLCGRGFRVPLPGAVDAPQQPTSGSPAAGAATPQPRASRRQRRQAMPEEPRHLELTESEPIGQPELAPALDDSQVAAAPAAEMQFQEPVRTVGSGDRVIALRRLTPEEKTSRRARRNLIMLLTGVSILMAIVLLLGTKRSKRRD